LYRFWNIPARKKWGIWNGKYWEIDDGSVLVHEKGLEMVKSNDQYTNDIARLRRTAQLGAFAVTLQISSF